MVKLFRQVLVLMVLLVAGPAVWDPGDAAALPQARGVPSTPSDAGGLTMRLPGVVILHAQQPPPQQQDEFVPIDQLPPQDQLPAAPLLVAAYSFVVLALFAYVVSVARRVGAVQRELERLGSELKRSGRT
jgi:CcmD family protein